MTNAEKRVLQLLGSAANEYSKLPEMHDADMHEFAHAIHVCQNLILAREGVRVMGYAEEGEPMIASWKGWK